MYFMSYQYDGQLQYYLSSNNIVLTEFISSASRINQYFTQHHPDKKLIFIGMDGYLCELTTQTQSTTDVADLLSRNIQLTSRIAMLESELALLREQFSSHTSEQVHVNKLKFVTQIE